VLVGKYAKIYEKIILSDLLVDKFIKFYAITLSLRSIAFKERNSRGIFLGKGLPKTIFLTASAKPAA